MKALRATLFSMIGTFAACSGGGSAPSSPEDASIEASAAEPSIAVSSQTSPLARARALLALARPNDDTFAMGVHGLVREGTAFVTEAFRNGNDPSLLGARVPGALDRAIHVGPGKLDPLSMDVGLVGAASVEGRWDDGRVVYADAYRATDVIVSARPRDLEIAYLLRDASAPHTFTLRLDLGAGLTAAKEPLPDGSLDFLDEHGDAALRIAPSFAIDAKGIVREVPMRWVDGALHLSLDPRGLDYPILVDPDLSVPVWQLRKVGVFSDYYSDGLAFSSTLKSVVAAGSIASKTFRWDGTDWISLGTIPGPSSFPDSTMSSFGTGVLFFASGQAFVHDGTSWTSRCSTNCGPGNVRGAKLAVVKGGAVITGGRIPNGAGIEELTARSGDDVDECRGPIGFIKTWFVTPGSTVAFTHRPIPSTTSCYDFGGTWTNQPSWLPTDAPKARFDHAFASDGDDTALLFGGTLASAGSTMDRDLGDTWIYHVATRKWEEVCGSSSPCVDAPSVRSSAVMTWDATRKKFVLYGGRARSLVAPNVAAPHYDTWEFDLATKTWTRVCANCFSGTEKPNAWNDLLEYDPNRRRSIGFFGQGTQRYTYEYYMRANACKSDEECNSGVCFQGVCCDAKCGTCQTCLAPSAVGQCTNVGAGEVDPLDRCGRNQACDGKGSCRGANGERCTTRSDCGSGNCVDGVCCETSSCGAGLTCAPAGTCRKINGGACVSGEECASGNCVDGVCCASASCGAGRRCDYPTAPGTCRADNGVACTTSSQCGSGFCVDGYCCNGACDSQCAACDVVKGTCTPVTGAPHGSRPACAGSGACGATCNGVDANACHFPGAATACGAASCSGSTATNPGTCDGAGGCTQTTTSCGAYVCGATACKTSCTGNEDCVAGHYCKTGACVPIEPLGEKCLDDAQCQSGHCVDSVCCSVASCGEGSACSTAASTTPGQCLKKNGVTCSAASECASGHCVDGLCCDTACNGQCEACDVGGSEGVCTPVVGQPRGGREACDTREPNDCAKQSCDGTVRDKCNGFANGATVACGETSCTASRALQKSGLCDGKGSCVMPDPISCVEYACDPARLACHTECDGDEQCNEGFTCDRESRKCIQGAHCSADRTESIDKTGVAQRCAPYTCGSDGKCQKQCATSDDCVSGTVCDTTTHACTGVAPAAEEGDGCGCSVPGASGSSTERVALAALAALGAALARRRRSAARG